jgi:hypothetical protein
MAKKRKGAQMPYVVGRASQEQLTARLTRTGAGPHQSRDARRPSKAQRNNWKKEVSA